MGPLPIRAAGQAGRRGCGPEIGAARVKCPVHPRCLIGRFKRISAPEPFRIPQSTICCPLTPRARYCEALFGWRGTVEPDWCHALRRKGKVSISSPSGPIRNPLSAICCPITKVAQRIRRQNSSRGVGLNGAPRFAGSQESKAGELSFHRRP